VLLARFAPSAYAQDRQPDPLDYEIPSLILEDPSATSDTDGELDLANIVQSAAKQLTTVQEAPAIVTVITADEIEDRGFRTLEEVVDTVPGWLRLGGIHNQFPFPLTRGVTQAAMYMHDGLSLFDPAVNVPQIWRVQPLETIKRIEMITGPGGVLWGANSYTGILNLITKDAEDVDGVEAAVQAADGDGDRDALRGYVMVGEPSIAGRDDLALWAHASFESYLGPAYEMPQLMFHSPLPQPNSSMIFGPLTRADPPRSFIFTTSAKLTLGPIKLSVSAPFVERHTPLGFPGAVIQKDRPEDTLRDPDGNLVCPDEPPFADDTDVCLDKGRRARDNRLDWVDRYVVAEHKRRNASGSAGVTARAYVVQFVRDFKHLQILQPIPVLLEGGLAFQFDATSYRTGTNIDGDLELPADLRLLYGFEAFHEWLGTTTERSRQGEGVEATFDAPYLLERIPLPCPRRPNGSGGVEFVEGCPLTFAFPASRTVLGAYVNPQWRPTKKLILDGGVRVQAAPESLGEVGYDTQTIFSGAFVYNFWPDWHLKLNYAEGFRAPVFNNTSANLEAVNVGGDPELETESSRAGQVEVNARLYRGVKRIRELSYRADYSYTRLDNLIQAIESLYVNTEPRGVHSAEFLGKLYISGGHRLELGYTWLRTDREDRGRLRTLPEHWFNLSGVFALAPDKLVASTRLRVLGAMEDANKLVEHRDVAYDDLGRVVDAQTGMPVQLDNDPHELVFDRLPPSADLTVGLTMPSLGWISDQLDKVSLSAYAYNAFDARYYQPDAFGDLAPRLEFLPNPAADFRFGLRATYRQ
jgi:outer membrane receptor protein involved in Fe transport